MSLRGFVKNYGRYLETDIDALMVMPDNQVGHAPARHVAVNNSNSLGPTDLPIQGEPVHRPWGWLLLILILLFVAGFYALGRGWVPASSWVLEWLQDRKSDEWGKSVE